ncbi:MAG TPA: outer membrane beta-barrel protein, partial [Nitrospirota bacterium]
YDDNVFVRQSNKVDDWYFITTPALLINLPQRKNLFELEYHSDIYNYMDTGKENNVVDQFLRGSAAFNFPGGLSLIVSDNGGHTHEARSESNIAVTGTRRLSKYYENILNAELSYKISDRFKAAVAYDNEYYNFTSENSDFRDRLENGVSGSVYYKFLPKTSAFVQGVYKNVYHNNGGAVGAQLNSDEYWTSVGLTWDATAKLSGSVKGGYQWKLFQNKDKNNFKSGIYQVGLDYKMTGKTTFRLTGTRQALETDDPNANFSTTTNGRLDVLYSPITNWTVNPYGSFANNRYSSDVNAGGDIARRNDNLMYTGFEVKYAPKKWWEAGVGYKHTVRSSNLTFYDYTDNLAYLSIRGFI